jgi:hypothetical protein
VFLLFSLLVVDLPVLVPVERQVALVQVPAAVLQVLVVQVQMMVQKDSFPYQSVEDLAAQLSDAYYKTSVFPFLSLQQILQFYDHTIHHDHHLPDPDRAACWVAVVSDKNWKKFFITYSDFR